MDDIYDTIVVGGGISGLTSALILKRKRYKVVLFESSYRAGGSILTHRVDDFIFELGPNTVLSNCKEMDDLFDLCDLLEKKLTALPQSKKRFIVKGGNIVPLPLGVFSLVTTKIFSTKAKLNVLKEFFVPPKRDGKEETVAEFAIRRLGKEFLDYAVGPFVSGVYAGDPEKLSLEHAVPKIYAIEQKYGSLIKGAISKRRGGQPSGDLISFPPGLQSLPETIASLLEDSFKINSRVKKITKSGDLYYVKVQLEDGTSKQFQSRSVIVAVPADSASEILSELDEDFSEGISSLPYAPIAVVSLGYKKEDVGHPLNGFGFLAPEVENRFVLGCLFPSSLFPNRAKRGCVSLTAFIGGAIHPERVFLEEEEILEKTIKDITPLLRIKGKPVFEKVTIWHKAIPQYLLGHKAYKSSAEIFEKRNNGAFISGNLLYGVSVANCIQNSTNLTKKVISFLQGDESDIM